MTERCPETQDGQQCVLPAGHTEPHTVATAWVGALAVPSGASVVTQVYKGSLENANRAYAAHAQQMAAAGYYPVGQVYTAGSWGCGAFLIALLLCLIVIGIVVFIYLLVVKPAGTLVVTYEKRR